MFSLGPVVEIFFHTHAIGFNLHIEGIKRCRETLRKIPVAIQDVRQIELRFESGKVVYWPKR